MARKDLVIIIFTAMVLMAALVVSLYKFNTSNDEIILYAEMDSSCNLNQSECLLRLDDGAEVVLSIEPRPIPVLKPLELKVEIHNLKSEKVVVNFKSIGMNMGINKSLMQQTSPGVFSAKGMLPVCVRNRMSWNANLLIQTPKGIISTSFLFDTTRR